MKKLLIVIGVVVVLGLIIFGWLSGTYNNFVKLSQEVDSQWAQVENVYQRRADLVPNLVETVKGGMAQEQKVFSEIAQARTKYAGATTTSEKAVAAGELEGALSRLLVIMENYPQLKSLDTVRDLMTQLEGTENRIAVERRRYNEVAKEYNTAIKGFISRFLAGAFGFEPKPYFEAQPGAEQAPKVQF